MRIILMISMMQIMLWGGAGDLDSSFGSDGKVTTDFGSGNDNANSVAIQSDGKIIVAGGSFNGSNYDIAVVRYDTEGNLDSSFGSDGKVTTDFGSSGAEAQSVAIQSDGKIVIAGYSYNGSKFNFAVVRYDTNGSLDSTFSGDGKVTTAVGSNGDLAESVAIQSDGKIVVAGRSNSGGYYNDIAVVRYDTDGSLDSTFGSEGIVTTAVGSSNDEAQSVTIQSDGKIIVAGGSHNGSDNDIAVVRYDTVGNLDSSFGSDGKVTTDFGNSRDNAYSVTIQSDGKIIVVGRSDIGSNDDFAMVRYDTEGNLDSTFSGDGKVTTAVGSQEDYARSVAIQSDGKIVVAGWSGDYPNSDFALVRYNSNGTLDTTFDSDGKVTTAVGSNSDLAQSVAIQSNGKIVVAGWSSNDSDYNDFAVVRYTGDPVITLAPIYYLLLQ